MQFSHENKIWFPKSQITKKMILTYYQNVAKYFIRHAKQHLIVLQRYPDGIDHPSFYQKQMSDYFPDFIHRHTVTLKKGGKQTLVIINNKQSLLYLVNQATIVFHSWLSTSSNSNKPDKIVFDLDPSTDDLKSLRFIAQQLKTILETHKLTPFIMTTGSRGYHIVVPIKPEHPFAKVHNFAKQIAQQLEQQYPQICTSTATKSKRHGKIFIDYLRNSYGQTSIAPYSVRALENAPVATPITWDALSKTAPQKYTVNNILTYLHQHKDAWSNFSKQRKRLRLP